MQSVISYPNRGKWGNSNWRGNCSGHVIKDLIEHFNPRVFVDICEGSGTSREVCKDLGVNYFGLDLKNGFDFTSNNILSRIGKPADIVFSHPPYHDIIKYSGEVWGKNSLNSDTSNCRTINEFLEKSQVMLLNQREATKEGGIYTSLIGDIRNKKFGFRSLQSDFISLMPKDELISVIVKMQHNVLSDSKIYRGNFIPIKHEYLLVWKRAEKSIFQVVWEMATDFKSRISTSWRSAIRVSLFSLGGKATLVDIYNEVERVGESLIKNNKNWKAKVRQQLQYHFTNVERGVWAL